MIAASKTLDPRFVFLLRTRKGSRKKSGTISEKIPSEQHPFTILKCPLGIVAVGRLWALARVVCRASANIWNWSPIQSLIVGNPYEFTPFLSFLVKDAAVVVVDDGLATLEIAEQRRAFSIGDAQKFHIDVFKPPIRWLRPLVFFTIFSELDFGTRDRKIRNGRLDGQQQRIRVHKESCWLLGSTAVEEGGMPFAEYKRHIASIVIAVTRAGLSMEYLPHRRESAKKVYGLAGSIGFQTGARGIPVEDRIIGTGKCPRVVLGFSSTALETLSLLTPSQCVLWNIYIRVPLSKKGRDSPEAIFERHKNHNRIRTVRIEDMWKPDLIINSS